MANNFVYDAVTGESKEVPLTPEQVAEIAAWNSPEAVYERELESVSLLRRNAYTLESDPLNFKWQETGLDVDRVAWLEKKDEIKARYPDPVKAK